MNIHVYLSYLKMYYIKKYLLLILLHVYYFLSYGLLNTRPGGGQGLSIRNLSTQIRLSYDIFNFKLNEKN